MTDGSIFRVVAPMQGVVVSVTAAVGELVREGQGVVVLESMKLEHVVAAVEAGVVSSIEVACGDNVNVGDVLLVLNASTGEVGAGRSPEEASRNLPEEASLPAPTGAEPLRAELEESLERHRVGLDAARPAAVAKRRKTGQRTARENVEDLIDPGSLIEYGPTVIAAQRRRRPVEDLIEQTPADGLVGGLATVGGRSVVVMSYDYTVLAGTQGLQNHRKKDRLFERAARLRTPVVFFTEGGGGRPGDTDGVGVSGLDCLAFRLFGELSGLVPLIGIASGRCFAGNAAILGCCDVVIATQGSNIGMGGPAMVEGGGLGEFTPEEIGPLDVQIDNGVVDIAVRDEGEAVAVAKRYLAYFGRPTEQWEYGDAAALREVVPENRRRVYDVRSAITALADLDSVLELRPEFGLSMVTAFACVEGRAIGIVANNPMHLAGAIDADGADKAARFMQLCDAFDIPVVFLCDTPGMMVGPEAEATALVRHVSRLFVVGASLTVPVCTIILRKAYGLGAQAMAAGSFKSPMFTVAWPTGELGGMGLEGAVKLGFRRELDAIADPDERERTFETMVDRMYEHGRALNAASHFEIDDVIDPADSRRWIVRALDAAGPPPPRTGKKRPCVDTW
ncbi:MAG TPA: carboxyl transferase domain-containing protein [Acidimicrobiales bacterium]|nr:carboxyl transferase domain-containing protein [Acidimicrobiales bacterium]